MYSIKYNNEYVYLPGDEDLIAITPHLTREKNTAGTLTFTILDTHPIFNKLEKMKYSVTVEDGGKVIFKGKIIDSTQNFYNEYDFTVAGKLMVLNDSPCRPYSFEGPPEELFTWFINNHNEQVSDDQKLLEGTVTVTDPNNYISRSWESTDNTWKLLNSRLVEPLGGFLVVRTEDNIDYLDWLDGFDLYSSQIIEFGENLIDAQILIDGAETYTACIPYGAEIENVVYEATEEVTWQEDTYYLLVLGSYNLIKTESEFNSAISRGETIYKETSRESTGEKLTIETVNNGKDYLINDSAASEYGVIYAPAEMVTWSDVTRPENLLIKANNWLNNEGVMLKESTELSFADLSKLGIDTGSVDLYDNVKVISPPHGINRSYLITKMEFDLDTPESLQVKIGDSVLTLVDRTVNEGKKQDATIERVEKIEKDYVVNEEVKSEIKTASSQILQLAEEITIGILSGYSSTDDLNNYKNEIENKLKANEEGFKFEFSQVESKLSDLGGEIVERNQFIRLEEGNIVIGKSDSPITAKFTNDALEYLYYNQVVARFTNEVLEVRNISVENQLRFGSDWAIRPGDYINGVGYNLNDVWIGG